MSNYILIAPSNIYLSCSDRFSKRKYYVLTRWFLWDSQTYVDIFCGTFMFSFLVFNHVKMIKNLISISHVYVYRMIVFIPCQWGDLYPNFVQPLFMVV